ncbi:hypothetical protein K438DRAFT_1991118 [Mycena galopus ATCC 62051]|nr:hypothetical protein K438DRAFT_1991118 [Mycena galopus ATCC 62051]
MTTRSTPVLHIPTFILLMLIPTLRRPSDDTLPPPPPVFAPLSFTFTTSATADIFGPGTRVTRHDHYVADSEGETGDEWAGCAEDGEEYSWGPEDDAPMPPESRMSTGADDTIYSDVECVPDDLPALQKISDSEEDASDDDGNSDTDDEAMLAHAERVHADSWRHLTAPSNAQPEKAAAVGRDKITADWKVETAEEKAVRLEKDAREYVEHAEEVRLEVEEMRKKKARARADGNERVRQHRDRVRAEKIVEGWKPLDLLDHDNTLAPDPRLADLTRPRRQFKEDGRKNNKPNGRKRKNAQPIALGYRIVPSKMSTYWSNHDTMHALVDDIIAPYFDTTKEELGLARH